MQHLRSTHVRLALLILAILLAGCTNAPSSEPSRTPVSATPAQAQTPAATNEVVFLYNESFENATRTLNASFQVIEGHWLCVLTNITRAEGDAVVTIETPNDGRWWPLADSTSVPSADKMIPWTGETFTVHVNLTGFTGRIALNVTNEA